MFRFVVVAILNAFTRDGNGLAQIIYSCRCLAIDIWGISIELYRLRRLVPILQVLVCHVRHVECI